jgi:hypothetical protein
LDLGHGLQSALQEGDVEWERPSVSADHAQSTFGLGLWSWPRLAKPTHILGHFQIHALQAIDRELDFKDAPQRLGHPTISMLNRQALAPILEQIGKVTLG